MVICNMDNSVTIELELSIAKGRGYVNADENKVVDAPVGVIAIDSIFTPIKNVKYTIENYRVEQKKLTTRNCCWISLLMAQFTPKKL